MKSPVPNLLISDDDRDLRETLADMFRRRGMQVRLAADGVQTLELLEECCPHLLLIDMNMPRRTGLEVVQTLNRQALPVPSILMSAQLDELLVEQALKASVYAVQVKPFSVREIQTIVDRALREHHGIWADN